MKPWTEVLSKDAFWKPRFNCRLQYCNNISSYGCFIKIQICLTCLMPAYPGCPGVSWSLTSLFGTNTAISETKVVLEKSPAHVVQWSNHLGAMCSRAWRSQWLRIDSSLGPGASAYSTKKELFQIIPMHMMTREIIPGSKTEGSTVPSMNCDRSSLI